MSLINKINFKSFQTDNLANDLFTGLVVAVLSIPLSIGYAQVAGLPPQYGLYGSFLPVLFCGLLTSSPRFVFGVDAVSAVMVATMLEENGVPFGSEKALSLVPVITFLSALWILLFWLLKAGNFAKFISRSVLEGCVSGISSIVILSQLPRLWRGEAASGRSLELMHRIWGELPNFHLPSFILGLLTILFVLWGQDRLKISPSAIVMCTAILVSYIFPLENLGIQMLSPIPKGLPPFEGPDLSYLLKMPESMVIETLSLAIVLVSETLVSTREFSRPYKDDIDNQRELFTYSIGNLVSVFWGNSPIGGSIARARRAARRGAKSQWMSISAFFCMGAFLLFGTPLLSHLPVPVLVGLVEASLITMLEFAHAKKLWKWDRFEFYIFMGAFLAEFIGIFEGVVVGVILSFASFTMRSCHQPRNFLGTINGRSGYFDLKREPMAAPLKKTIMYEFQGALFYANADDFEADILGSLKEDTSIVVITGTSSVDFHSAILLKELLINLSDRGIALRMVDPSGNLREQLKAFGLEADILDGMLCPTMEYALGWNLNSI